MCSAVVRMFDCGALTTITPCAVAASTSTLSSPMPARPTTTRSCPAASTSAVTVVADRMIRAWAPGMAATSCLGVEVELEVDLVAGGPEAVEAAVGDLLGDEDAGHPRSLVGCPATLPTRYRGGLSPACSGGAGGRRGRPAPGPCRRARPGSGAMPAEAGAVVDELLPGVHGPGVRARCGRRPASPGGRSRGATCSRRASRRPTADRDADRLGLVGVAGPRAEEHADRGGQRRERRDERGRRQRVAPASRRRPPSRCPRSAPTGRARRAASRRRSRGGRRPARLGVASMPLDQAALAVVGEDRAHGERVDEHEQDEVGRRRVGERAPRTRPGRGVRRSTTSTGRSSSLRSSSTCRRASRRRRRRRRHHELDGALRARPPG